jgi:hypothetical protein
MCDLIIYGLVHGNLLRRFTIAFNEFAFFLNFETVWMAVCILVMQRSRVILKLFK